MTCDPSEILSTLELNKWNHPTKRESTVRRAGWKKKTVAVLTELFLTRHDMMSIKLAILDVRILGLERVFIPPLLLKNKYLGPYQVIKVKISEVSG